MPIDFTSQQYAYPKQARNGTYPLFATNSSNGFDRVEPLVTPDILISDWLFGVPLYDRINKRQITNDDLKRVINRAVCQLELDLKINIFPVQRDIKLPFDSSLFRAFGHIEIPFKPVQTLLNFYIEDADQINTYQFPPQIIDTGNLTLGQLNFGPVTIATADGAVLNSLAAGSGGTLILTNYINLAWIPQFFILQCITGFKENEIPTVVNELIAITAALEIFSRVSVLFKNNSQSIGHDGLSQSISGPGPAVFNQRIDQLQAKKAQMLDQLRHTFYNSIMVSNI